MITLHNITTLEEPELRPYRTLRRPQEHQREGIFVAEGEKVVRRLLQSPLSVHSVLLTPQWFELLKPMLEQRADRILVFVAAKTIVETIVGYNLHQGVMAVGKIPHPPSLEAVLAEASRPHLLAALDGLTNAENLGVLVRNCAAFGVQGILVGETSSSPYLRRAVRNSMGTVFRLPIIHTTSLVGMLHNLRNNHGIVSLAAHPHGETQELFRTDLKRDLCFVFGSEGEGISTDVLGACDERVTIPMAGGVDSLNVASAAAVVLAEAARQRREVQAPSC